MSCSVFGAFLPFSAKKLFDVGSNSVESGSQSVTTSTFSSEPYPLRCDLPRPFRPITAMRTRSLAPAQLVLEVPRSTEAAAAVFTKSRRVTCVMEGPFSTTYDTAKRDGCRQPPTAYRLPAHPSPVEGRLPPAVA